MVPLKKKKELLVRYVEIFQSVEVPINVLKRNDENRFEVSTLDFKDVVKELDKMATIRNLEDYVEHKGLSEKVNVQLIIELLKKREVPFSVVVVNKEFSEILNSEVCDKIMIISEMNSDLYLKSYTTQDRKLPTLIDAPTKKYLLENLLKKGNSALHYGFHNNSARRFITGIDEYKEICTTMVPFGIGGEWYYSIRYIISPVTIKQWECNKHLDENAFVSLVCASDEFINLINHVYNYQIEKGKYTKEEITEKYREFIGEMYSICKS